MSAHLPLIHLHAVVAQELLAGVVDAEKARLVQTKRMSPGGFGRSFVHDCLLGASCREEGLTLITRNTRDFELVREVEEFDLAAPWPE